MGLITLEAIGPKGEQLAMRAADVTEIPVGWDGESSSATFDSDMPDEELQAVLADALGGIDPEWQDHLRVAE